MENKLIWLDLEMTGLDPNSERIIEIFTAVTDENLTEIIEGPDLVIKQPNEILDQMDEWNQEHHKKSGLLCKPDSLSISNSIIDFYNSNYDYGSYIEEYKKTFSWKAFADKIISAI